MDSTALIMMPLAFVVHGISNEQVLQPKTSCQSKTTSANQHQ